jgi:anti-sigma B factor antagonist
MLQIQKASGQVVLAGRFDATQVDTATEVFGEVEESVTVRFDDLEYISSAGLGVLLHTQQRLARSGHTLRLAGMTPHVRLVFEYSGLDSVFPIY